MLITWLPKAVCSPAGVECGRDVPRPAARRDQYRIETDIGLGVFGVAGEPSLRGGGDPALLPGRHGFPGVVQALARLYFDKHQNTAAPHDEVDFADRTFPAARDDA